MMTSAQIKDDVAERGEQIYEEQIRSQVETEDNIGKIITIDVGTGDYEIDSDLIQAVHRLKMRRPEAMTWTKRIGYNAVYAVGGTLTRTSK